MKTRTRWLMIIVGVTSVLVVSLFYLIQQNISEAANLCIEIGGTPEIDRSLLTLTWQFECRSPSADNM